MKTKPKPNVKTQTKKNNKQKLERQKSELVIDNGNQSQSSALLTIEEQLERFADYITDQILRSYE